MLTPQTQTVEILRGRYDPVTDTGYMGFISASNFITGSELINLLNFHGGIDQNSDAGWLKFYVGPNAVCNRTNHIKIIYIAKRSFKCDISWDNIKQSDLVYGNRIIIVDGFVYRVRLLTGGEASPGTGSEWNELIYRVHAEQPESKSNWETFNTKETNITNGSGRYTWCQETPPSKPTEHVYRGYYGVAPWHTIASSYSTTNIGWRPVLELASTGQFKNLFL